MLNGPSAVPTRPIFFSTPLSQLKPTKQNPSFSCSIKESPGASKSIACTHWCQRQESGSSGSSILPFQLSLETGLYLFIAFYLFKLFFYKSNRLFYIFRSKPGHFSVSREPGNLFPG